MEGDGRRNNAYRLEKKKLSAKPLPKICKENLSPKGPALRARREKKIVDEQCNARGKGDNAEDADFWNVRVMR